MPFEFLEFTAATLMSMKPTTDKDGEDFAIVAGLDITGPNTLLDKLSPSLRRCLFKPADETMEPLPGVEPDLSKLRVSGIDKIDLRGELVGWTLHVDHGIDEGDPLVLGDCLVNNLRVRPLIGDNEGRVSILCNVRSSDVDSTEAGLLCSLLRHEIRFKLIAPIPQEERPRGTEATGAEIDGTSAAFEADHPDATDLFAAEHGEGGGSYDEGEAGPGPDDEQPDGDGSDTDAAANDAAAVEPARGRGRKRA